MSIHIDIILFAPPPPPPSYRLEATLAIPFSTGPTPADPNVYQPPTTGILSYFPPSFVPYAELVHLDKPTGRLFSLAPSWTQQLDSRQVLSTALLFGARALIMRGAGCTINDLWDRNIDPKITRTKFRPIARRAITDVGTRRMEYLQKWNKSME